MRFSAARVRRAAVATAVATSSLIGFALVSAAPASALDSSSCTRNDTNHWMHPDDTLGAPVRNGPSNKAVKNGHLDYGDPFYVYCSAKNLEGNRWYYGKTYTYGVKGWVYSAWLSNGKW